MICHAEYRQADALPCRGAFKRLPAHAAHPGRKTIIRVAQRRDPYHRLGLLARPVVRRFFLWQVVCSYLLTPVGPQQKLLM